MAGIAITPAVAGEFDGLYKQGPDADCTLIGVDGGALKIEDNVFFGVESICRMERPVDVVGMDAYLFDMDCSAEGTNWSARALFMHAADDGLIMVWNGYAFKYDRCPVVPDTSAPAPAEATETPASQDR